MQDLRDRRHSELGSTRLPREFPERDSYETEVPAALTRERYRGERDCRVAHPDLTNAAWPAAQDTRDVCADTNAELADAVGDAIGIAGRVTVDARDAAERVGDLHIGGELEQYVAIPLRVPT